MCANRFYGQGGKLSLGTVIIEFSFKNYKTCLLFT